jgi:hypothetical protein
MAGTCFRRNRLWFILSIVAAILPSIPLIMIMIAAALGGDTVPGIDQLWMFSRINFYLQMFFVCSSFEFFSRAKSQNISEVLESTTGGRPAYSFYLLLWQAGVLGLILLVPLVVILLPPIIFGGQAYFLSHASKPILANVILPSLISMLLGYVLAMRTNRLTAYGWILVFVLLISPFAEKFIWRVQPQGLPIDQVFKYIRWPFAFLYQGDFAFGSQYGLQTEIPRWQILLFWLFLFIGLSPLVFSLSRKISVKTGVKALFLLLAGAFLFFSYLPASLFRLNDNWDSSANVDNYYYDEHDSSLSLQGAETPNYRITDYTLSVELKRQLAVVATLHLVADTARQSYIFTLYHGYLISSVSQADGNPIAFKQNGDFVTLDFAAATAEATIHLAYAGSAGNLYSNSEAVLLPGYFPWYPMAGKRQVWLTANYLYFGFNPLNRVEPADFSLEVSGIRSIVTNLPTRSDGTFSGKADSLSLFGGHIIPSEDPIITTQLPLQAGSKYREKLGFDILKSSYTEALAQLADEYGIATSDLTGKRIIRVSNDLDLGNNNFVIAVFDDYILLATPVVFSEELIKYVLIEGGRAHTYLIGAFLDTFYSHSDEKSFSNFVDSWIAENNDAMTNLQAQGRPISDSYRLETRIMQSLHEAIDKRGAEVVMKSLQEYILDFDTPIDDQAFINNLLEEDENAAH